MHLRVEKVRVVGVMATAGIAANRATGPSSAGVRQVERGASQGRQALKEAMAKVKEKPLAKMEKMRVARPPAKQVARRAGAQMDSKGSVTTAWNSAIVPNGAPRAKAEVEARSVGWEVGAKIGIKTMQERKQRSQCQCSPSG